MPQISLAKSFTRRCAKLNPVLVKQAEDALKKFVANPLQPSLNFEKVVGTHSYHTIRINGSDRLVLRRMAKATYEVVDLGTHTYVYNLYG